MKAGLCYFSTAFLIFNSVLATIGGSAFTDTNWISMGGFPGTSGTVYAAATDASGTLYVAGAFTVAGSTNANFVAKWDGTNWFPLGSGVNGTVRALAISGNTLYAAGSF